MIEAALHSVLQEGVSGNKAAENSQETKMVIQLEVKKMRVVVPVLRWRMPIPGEGVSGSGAQNGERESKYTLLSIDSPFIISYYI